MKMLDYAALAYSDCPQSGRLPWLHFESSPNGVQFLIGRNPFERQTVISFRGTDSLQDLLTDLRFWKKHIPYDSMSRSSKIRVHSGFCRAYQHPRVRDFILKFLHGSSDKILVVGHSYGAALAMLCALDIQYNYPHREIEAAVFGCPRIGNSNFRESYNRRVQRTIRFENGNDLVTKIPPWLFGFRHAGAELHIGFMRLFGVYAGSDHALENYKKSLMPFAENAEHEVDNRQNKDDCGTA